MIALEISEHEPRKGTETSATIRLTTNITPFQNTNPERGRKLVAIRRIVAIVLQFQNTNPERGRKRTDFSGVSENEFFISEHEPRKGTETSKLYRQSLSIFAIFQNTNPERGRKRLRALGYPRVPTNFRTRTPKGDGNNIFHTFHPFLPIYFRTRTPKGDGNPSSQRVHRIRRRFISEHEPRKGTETLPFVSPLTYR